MNLQIPSAVVVICSAMACSTILFRDHLLGAPLAILAAGTLIALSILGKK